MVAKSPYLIDKGFDHTVVPGAGLEPARSKERGILNPLCLPISPPGHIRQFISKQYGVSFALLYLSTICGSLPSLVLN